MVIYFDRAYFGQTVPFSLSRGFRGEHDVKSKQSDRRTDYGQHAIRKAFLTFQPRLVNVILIHNSKRISFKIYILNTQSNGIFSL